MSAIIALVVNREDQTRIKTIADELGLEVQWSLDIQGVVKHVADLRPLLMLIDLGGDTWQAIVHALRMNPATRRLAIIGFYHRLDEGRYQAALALRVDEIFMAEDDSRGAVLTTLKARMMAYARQTDAELRSSLADSINEPLPPLALEGVEAFNAGQYYDAHESLERAWMDESRPIRDLYRGILQISVAYYHIQGGNYWGALKMFLRSLQWLAPLPDCCQGIDVEQLRQDAKIARQALEHLGVGRIGEFDRHLLKPILYHEAGC